MTRKSSAKIAEETAEQTLRRRTRNKKRYSAKTALIEKRLDHWKTRIGHLKAQLQETQRALTAANAKTDELAKKLQTLVPSAAEVELPATPPVQEAVSGAQ